MTRTLIVTADDFGQSVAITRGIRRAHENGIVTSASLMVRHPAAAYATEQAGKLDLGLHIDLGEWAHRQGSWIATYERVDTQDAVAVEAEIQFQLTEFRRLTGIKPSHLDSHQHVHFDEPVRSIARRIAEGLGIPLRGVTAGVQYCGKFYGQSGKGELCHEAVGVESLIRIIEDLPVGITELACHPGESDGTDTVSTYSAERVIELATLCHPLVLRAIDRAGVRLCSFRDLADGNAWAHAPQRKNAKIVATELRATP